MVVLLNLTLRIVLSAMFCTGAYYSFDESAGPFYDRWFSTQLWAILLLIWTIPISFS